MKNTVACAQFELDGVPGQWLVSRYVERFAEGSLIAYLGGLSTYSL